MGFHVFSGSGCRTGFEMSVSSVALARLEGWIGDEKIAVWSLQRIALSQLEFLREGGSNGVWNARFPNTPYCSRRLHKLPSGSIIT